MLRTAVCIALSGIVSISARAEPVPVDVPRVQDVTIDGDGADWAEGGLRVNLLTSVEGKTLPAADFDAKLRLGWDPRGLLALIDVSDDAASEVAGENFWERDSLELFIVGERDVEDFYQFVASPGIDPERPELRHQTIDRRADRGRGLNVQIARKPRAGGYVLELLMPFSAFAIEPQAGTEVGFNLYLNDSDAGEPKFRIMWYPSEESWSDGSKTQRLRLAEEPSAPVDAAAGVKYVNFNRTRVRVATTAERIGQEVHAKAGEQVLGEATVAADENGRGTAKIDAPMPPIGLSYPSIEVLGEGQVLAHLTPEDANAARRKELARLQVVSRPFILDSDVPPEIDFLNPNLSEELIGPYEVRVTLYDKDYDLVTAPARPGRYGAVVKFVPVSGGEVTRYVTLFRQPAEVEWWPFKSRVTVGLPDELGIDPKVVDEQQKSLGDFVTRTYTDNFFEQPWGAIMLAGLAESKSAGRPVNRLDDFAATDRQWWVGLKRKLYDVERQYIHTIEIPTKVPGLKAPTLREGSASEAGMRPDAVEKIDAVCKEWLETGGVEFNIVVARNGVAFFKQAYGQRDGRPLTTDDASPLASISKLICSTMFMSMADRGLVGLDDEVGKYLPPLRDVEAEKPITFRHLFTHTAGLEGHWGEYDADLEHKVADLYPVLEVGQKHEYHGVGYELAGKVMELIAGKSMPQVYKHHLFGPLGLAHSDATYMAWSADMSAPDLTVFGQMLLNKGAYGDLRFMNEKTLESMLPRKLSDVLGPDATTVWGIGTMPYAQDPPASPEPGLSESAFGHGSATGSILRVDPENRIVLSVARNLPGEKYGEFVAKLTAAVRQGVAK